MNKDSILKSPPQMIRKHPGASLVFLLIWAVGNTLSVANEWQVHSFTKQQLTDEFWAEGAYLADFNRDGQADIVYGPFWFEGPDFSKRHEYRPASQTFKRKLSDGSEITIPGFEGARGVNNAYADNFLTYTYDFNQDGWPDILIYGFPGKEAVWYENPNGKPGHWRSHAILNVLDNESPGFGDITGDGKPEIICCSEGYIGYAQVDWKQPDRPWKFHPVSPKSDYQRYTHGLGFGDVNGDGRVDILEKDGWWEQPATLSDGKLWTKHSFAFGEGGAQMFAYDVNGDGLNDVITSLSAHGYGIAWFEQTREKGNISFRKHIIINQEPAENPFGVKFSQPHALDLVDLDGDGLKDLITGKRFWAHGSAMDPEPNAPAVLYWFKLVRLENYRAEFIPHLVDDDSGVGTQVAAADINGDGLPDIVVGNKKGAFVFTQKRRTVPQSEWHQLQPKRLSGTPAPAN